MAYYTALINQWGALAPGTTAQKLAAINALTITGSVPTSFFLTGSQLLNCINYNEFKALTAAQQGNLLALCNSQGSLLGGSANTAFMAAGMILDYFSNKQGPTIMALTALAQATVTPWWQANNYPGPFTNNDLVAAGLS